MDKRRVLNDQKAEKRDRNNQLVRVGTSGIVLPVNKADFPDEFKVGTRLHYYASLFNTLEINSSFYKIPKRSTFEKWSSEVPDDFTFTVKLWRDITHAKNLEYSPADVDRFIDAADGLGEKRGCLLIQFPASIRLEQLHAVEKLLQHLDGLNADGRWQLAIELRHTTWYQEQAYAVFAKYKTALVLHDMPNSKTPLEYLTSKNAYTKCLYLRFHGPTGHYNGSYSNQFIDSYAEHIAEWQAISQEIYVYFNNTIGSALDNAHRLKKTNII